MRVAYFTDALPPMADGVTRSLSRLVETLPQHDVAFRFFAGVRPDPGLPWRDRVHKVTGFRVPLPLYPSYRLGLPVAGLAALRAFRPDVVHVLSPTLLGLFGVEGARRLGIPVVGSFHTDFMAYLRFHGLERWERHGWRYLRWFYNRCSVTLAPSSSMAQRLRENGVERVGLWERGIDPQHFSPALRSEALRERARACDRPLLLYVGRLVREKNLEDLAAAVAILNKTIGPDAFRLAIVGDGPFAPELKQRLPHAHFAGYQQNGALARWYASADLFVFPSTTETFGNVVLEALASGVPVVGADACGTRDLVQHGVNGLLCQPNDPADLARNITWLLTDATRLERLSDAAEVTALRYRWPDVNARLLESYRVVVRGVARAA
jgi:glycosyltransferase involved in cell wall biosynthesis